LFQERPQVLVLLCSRLALERLVVCEACVRCDLVYAVQQKPLECLQVEVQRVELEVAVLEQVGLQEQQLEQRSAQQVVELAQQKVLQEA
jgi:hypothetical protein